MAISRLFAFAYVWAMGGNLMRAVHEDFDEFAREQLSSVANFPGGSSWRSTYRSSEISSQSISKPRTQNQTAASMMMLT
jgi:hypothetical protein